MSLINEALKKAQSLRGEETADTLAPSGAGPARIVKRNKPHSVTFVVLLASAALVLVLGSVAVTIYLVSHSAGAKADRTTATSASPSVPALSRPATIEIASAPAVPRSSEPVVTATPTIMPPSAPAVASPEPSAAATASSHAEPAPAPRATPPPRPAPPLEATPAAPPGPDPRVTAFVQTIRVTGIRSLGAESRVLLNDRVYRINDIIDRILSVRLTQVSVDSLTFSDSNGVTYLKYF